MQARVQGRVRQEWPGAQGTGAKAGGGVGMRTHKAQVAEFRALAPSWCPVPLKGCDTWPYGLTWTVASGQCHSGPEAAAARGSSA